MRRHYGRRALHLEDVEAFQVIEVEEVDLHHEAEVGLGCEGEEQIEELNQAEELQDEVEDGEGNGPEGQKRRTTKTHQMHL